MPSKSAQLARRMVALSAVFLWVLALPLSAQSINNKTAIGFPENGVFTGSDFDTAQLTNGNLHIEIPLWSLPQRGLPPLSAKYVYDNKGWYTKVHCGHMGICTSVPDIELGTNAKWNRTFSWTATMTQKIVNQPCSAGNQTTYTSRMVRDGDGTKHHMLPD